ncbi:MAG: glucoamylase family protein [Anaerolineaceae bacterium]
MERHGETLAFSHELGTARTSDHLLARLKDNEAALRGVQRQLVEAVNSDRPLTPAGEWLLDNFYVIEEQVRTARAHLPRGYDRELPRLRSTGAYARVRVYDIALEVTSHGDGEIEPEVLNRFLAAYQKVSPLKLGELWAIPIMFRLALIENLRRLGVSVAAQVRGRDLAAAWADQMREMAESDPTALVLVIADMVRSNPSLEGWFVAELARRLEGQGPALAFPLTWIELRLSDSGLTMEQLVRAETRAQAANEISISNSIASLRLLEALDWRDFVEAQSLVDQTLREDPADVYHEMDFVTRDHYRHAIEEIERNCPLSEGEVARKAVQLAQTSASAEPRDERAGHVGYYLIDKGRPELERVAGVRVPPVEAFRRRCARVPLLLFVGAIVLIAAALSAAALPEARATGANGWAFLVIGIASFATAMQLGVTLVNWLACSLIPPQPLPRLDFSKGIPPESNTLVVVPAMLTSPQSTADLLADLELRFVANRDRHLHFGLLTDFADAAQEELPGDANLLDLARQGIEGLNEKYGETEAGLFFLFHRPRRWNHHDHLWMGYERKRGKLSDLNALLRGADSQFALVVGDSGVFPRVRYVITLDTDTQLPRDTARSLIGAMAHTLNRPRFDERKRRVIEGYGILQPRVTATLESAARSRYARLGANEPGIDPYTQAVSDVYQDVFGEGSFVGKGIYDVDAFEAALKGAFPENRILSHDLLEGAYARSGHLSDVQLYEHHPATYGADASRRYRWMRGDWQIAQWLLPRVPGPDGARRANPLSALSRWKILDNLRRSVTPAAMMVLLLVGWTNTSVPWVWTAAVLGVMFIPAVAARVPRTARKTEDVPIRQHLADVWGTARLDAAQAVFSLACLPYEAWLGLSAGLRTLWRLMISRRRLLEWRASADADPGRADLVGAYRSMWIGPLVAVALAASTLPASSAAWATVFPVLLLWLTGPGIVWWVGRPLTRREVTLTGDQVAFLRKSARKTWEFFDTFVGADDHWLPPDNFQEEPVGVVAHRTSPTNMGLALLANLTAYDFGYVSAGALVERTSQALRTMEAMERYRGHFFNWYDTQSLKPLPPLYISTVDSGNLAGHLLTLGPGLLALREEPILDVRVFAGLSDTFGILVESMGAAASAGLGQLRTGLASACAVAPASLEQAYSCLSQLAADAMAVVDGLGNAEGSVWANAFVRQCQSILEDLRFLAPWVSMPGMASRLGGLGLPDMPTLQELAGLEVDELAPSLEGTDELRPLAALASERAKDRIAIIIRLAQQSCDLADFEYDFLFDETRRLLAIGYNTTDHRRDKSFYDLLASEARLGIFVAIAQGRLPQEVWFALGRPLTTAGGESTLLSWSGSMFEYLMPLLVMPTFAHTLLEQTCRATVARQVSYGRLRGVPWGVSESAYNGFDVHLNYQYRAFGVPGLGLKRGLAHDLVIAPYASALALMVEPDAACVNLQRLAEAELTGRYGFYEAIDYTPSRLPRDRTDVVVRTFMAHHQGMTLLSLAYVLLNRPMQRRFESHLSIRATTLLLQERVPKAAALYSHVIEHSPAPDISRSAAVPLRAFRRPDTSIPEVHLLSNGRYHVMVTNAGGGYSRWGDHLITRWREDTTRDNWGSFCYIHDLESGDVWSTAYHPTLHAADSYEVVFLEGSAVFHRVDGVFETVTEIAVSTEDDVELRRSKISNRSATSRTIEVTSYAEIVLTNPANDALHTAFSNLFVQTEIVEELQAVLCTRRPRSREEHHPSMFHVMTVHGADSLSISHETDRAQFIGRDGSVAAPQALRHDGGLSNTQGAVLDPIVATRHRFTIQPGETVTVVTVSGIGDTRAECLSLAAKYRDWHLADRIFLLAGAHGRAALHQLSVTEEDAHLYAQLVSSVIYASSALRADASVLRQNRRGQSGLWGYAISGDLPIVLLQIEDATNIELVRQLIKAHAYWSMNGLAVDLVIWNEERTGYRHELQEQINDLLAVGGHAPLKDRRTGRIFPQSSEYMSAEDRTLLQSFARAIITDKRGTLAEQLNRRVTAARPTRPLIPSRNHEVPERFVQPPPRELILHNGLGGFTPDGREYVIQTSPGHVTPAPWANVIANPDFGCIVSENGVGYTWSENAHEFRLTPWENDPVTDASGEGFYLRDEESGEFWSPSPLPVRGSSPYLSRHGFGYSVFEHSEHEIRSEFSIYVAPDAPVKFAVLKVRNESGRLRRLSVTGYVEWVLGDLHPKSTMHVVTDVDFDSGVLYARNPNNTEFPDRVAFFDTDEQNVAYTGDRREFLGRNGTPANPEAMRRARLSGRVGAGMDPCGAIQVPFELASGQEREIIFRLGAGRSRDDASALARRFSGSAAALEALEATWRLWERTLGAVQVNTPDPALNVMANGWLMYQTIACRLWARSGYYQSGGAFGFRDQLQDAMAVIHAEAGLLRQQLLLAASRQFVEGDVQHWWHPPLGRGVRTQCSDDYLWLPLAASRYVRATGDSGLLDEEVPFLEGREVRPDEDSYYDLPATSGQTASLYDHCKRAILRGLNFGTHGLPLMGSGDWNDGMNTVGAEGKGESVWLGFFLYHVLTDFSEVARLRGDAELVARCQVEAVQLRTNLEANGWDGEWYLRAFFDDGTPLGSASGPECKIDSVSQSWSVLSGAGSAARARMAMGAVDRRLVRRKDQLVQLLDPPFDSSSLEPGYIKGYVPGVRENGGQYTHAAIWCAMAFAELGDAEHAWELQRMINPVNHGNSPDAMLRYKVEPYVVAADVYSGASHAGRGGWSWYTGSAGWMYRLIVESLLGLRLEVDRLRFVPCLPSDWDGYALRYRYRETFYDITVRRTREGHGQNRVIFDGVEQSDPSVRLVDDRAPHHVEVSVDISASDK